MNTAIAFHLLEKGEACCLYASILIMRVGDRCYISFDGENWEETESELIKEQI
jgi:hypothetical protein